MDGNGKLRSVRLWLTAGWVLAPVVAIALFYAGLGNAAGATVAIIDGLGAAWTSFFAAGVISRQLTNGSETQNGTLRSSWTFEHAPLLCWPLVRAVYSPTAEAALRGVSRDAILLFRTAHVAFVATIIVLLMVMNWPAVNRTGVVT